MGLNQKKVTNRQAGREKLKPVEQRPKICAYGRYILQNYLWLYITAKGKVPKFDHVLFMQQYVLADNLI